MNGKPCTSCRLAESLPYSGRCRACYAELRKTRDARTRAKRRSTVRSCARCRTVNALAYSVYCRDCMNAVNRALPSRKYSAEPLQRKKRGSARAQARKAVERGTLFRPSTCARCVCTAEHMHHADYSKPLEVEWLCTACHLQEHGKQPCSL